VLVVVVVQQEEEEEDAVDVKASTSLVALSSAVLQPSPIEAVIAWAESPSKANVPSSAE
jgi:hypothetical protein